jgi:hypothetical protein
MPYYAKEYTVTVERALSEDFSRKVAEIECARYDGVEAEDLIRIHIDENGNAWSAQLLPPEA